MSELTEWQTVGIRDLFGAQPTSELATSIAKVVSKNMLTPQDLSDAVDVILLHSGTVYSILNRRSITKEILFKYLHDNKVSVMHNFTKQLLIDKVLQFWKQSHASKNNESNSTGHITTYESNADEESSEIMMFESDDEDETTTAVVVLPSSSQSIANNHNEEDFPINQMARKFANWFYTNLNSGQLQSTDFWIDVQCSAQFLERGICVVNEEHCSNTNVLTFCESLRNQYRLYFNLNETHSGTQGRIDCHGLVLVLSCGTLHKIDQMVGIFECVFGLTRDPFSENNWKINQLKMKLHNNPLRQQQTQHPIALQECETLAPLLSLTVSSANDGIG